MKFQNKNNDYGWERPFYSYPVYLFPLIFYKKKSKLILRDKSGTILKEILSDNNPQSYQEKCKEILLDPEIRFCGLVNSKGELVAGGFKEGVVPLENDEDRQKIFQELASRVASRKKFDSNMGRVKYSASRREKLVMISFPIEGKIILVTAEPNINIDRLAYRIIEKLGKQWYEFYGQ